MEVDLYQLKLNYSKLSDDALTDVYFTADLIDGARELLVNEIESRGLDIDVEDYISHVGSIEQAKDQSISKVLSPVIFYTIIVFAIYSLGYISSIYKHVNFELIFIVSAVIYFVVGIFKTIFAINKTIISDRPIWCLKDKGLIYKISMFIFATLLWPFTRY